jgi:chemotaxis protein methyltransferase CheR
MGSDHAFLVETRLSSLARKEGFENLETMVQELFSVGKSRLAIQVVSALVERDTHFNRDPKSLDTLFNTVLPELVEKRGGGRIDLLSYGCGSGQDIYSIAVRARYAAARAMMGPVALHMTGVDYPSQALERARTGRYTHFEAQRGLSARDLIANFTPDLAPGSTDWLVAAHLQENVTFQEMHLMAGADELDEFHIVMFRGAIGHYSRTARVRVIRGLTKVLRPYGYLILGSGEELLDNYRELEPVPGTPGLYRRLKFEPVLEPVGKQPNGRTTFDGSNPQQAASN